jgi:hypothetical protein
MLPPAEANLPTSVIKFTWINQEAAEKFGYKEAKYEMKLKLNNKQGVWHTVQVCYKCHST